MKKGKQKMLTRSRNNKSNAHPSAAADYAALERTTDLAAIKGRKTLVLLDEQNLSITARNLGYKLQYEQLAERIRETVESAELHIFVAADPADVRTAKEFAELGYVTHVKAIRHKFFPGRRQCDCNVDNLFAFWTGQLTVGNKWDVIVLASGDYGLSGELSEAICRQHVNRPLQLTTLSLPGSTSQDLDARINPNITANLEIGLDLLKPLRLSTRRLPAAVSGSYRKLRFISHVS
jgi:hypothetical protein